MTYPGNPKDWRERPLLRRWHRRIAAGHIEELSHAPGDLRTPEPGFIDEVVAGSIGLAGETLTFGAGSPFRAISPSLRFARELHGFGWLRHLDANRGEAAEEVALKLMRNWVDAGGRGQLIACEPAVTARRVLSWLAHGGIALHTAPLVDYDIIMDALAEDASWLARKTGSLPIGIDRLLCRLALLEVAICRPAKPAEIATFEAAFLDDLDQQFGRHGAHVSRSPEAAIDVLLDLVPLRQFYASRHAAPPELLTRSVEKMLGALSRLRLGDGSIARFNGMGATVLDRLSVLLGAPAAAAATDSVATVSIEAGYARLDAGKTIVVADFGAPPPKPWRDEAHAGALSFEMSLGGAMLFANCGVGVEGASGARGAGAMANASTLVIGNVPPFADEDVRGGGDARPIRMIESAEAVGAESSHEGYWRRFGLVHQRRLALSRDGRRLDGFDELLGKAERLDAGIPYAVHFRLHPSVRVDLDVNGDVRLAAANGMRARFKTEQGLVSIEPAMFQATLGKPQPCMAIVVHARANEAARIDWHVSVGN